MWLRNLLRKLRGGLGAAELARRLGLPLAALRALEPSYRERTIPKRSGGARVIFAPDPDLKGVQRLLLRRVLARLRSHPAATGFVRGGSIVRNALPHAAKAVVVRMDFEDFFASTRAERVRRYFRAVGWGREASALLTRLTTWKGGLPAGAPTSPLLSNLVNFRLDRRLAGLARAREAAYTRYADDLTFSFEEDRPGAARDLIRAVRAIAAAEGYRVHRRGKLRVLRRHQRQTVTGLTVNDRPNLPRARRRWLRAVEHRAATGGRATLTPEQIAGWRAFRSMVEGRPPAGCS